MTESYSLTVRNLKLYFKDKGAFFPSLITPVILLVLYATFLSNVYRDSFISGLPEGTVIDSSIINAAVAGQLIASLLAVSCVTVSFCANLLMIGDKAKGTINDLTITPVKRSAIAVSYYAASALSTLIISFTAMAICFVYLTFQGWYLSVTDVVGVVISVLLLTLFGTALSSCIHFFLHTNGQASAVGTVISSCYGFICGAYMPISSFPAGLQRVLKFLPGTYGTSLLKNNMLRGVFDEMKTAGLPTETINGMKKALDCNITFSGHVVPQTVMLAVLSGAVIIFTGLFVLLNTVGSYNAEN